MRILKCPACGKYTLEERCSACKKETVRVSPAKFSPEDKYGEYRRKYKKEI